MRQLKRIDLAAPADAYRKAQRGLLRHFGLDETEFRTLERERPELVIVDGEAVLAGRPRDGLVIELGYAYPDRDAFARQFPAMFQRLLQGARQDETPLGFRFTLLDRPSRPYVEPVLRAHVFELQREWMQMTLHDLSDAPGPDVPSGFALRLATPEDAQTIVELEEAAFPYIVLTPQAVAGMLDAGQELWLLEEQLTGRAAGYLRLRRQPPATGYLAILAVHPDYQRHGLGEALLCWALARFREQGLRRVVLTVTVDNAPAIALYRKLGFVPGDLGLDYRRPIDEDEVRQVLEKHRGSHIKFGGWR